MIGDEFKHISSALYLNRQINARDEKIEEIVEDNGRHDDKHSALRVGVGEPQFWESVHDEAEGDGKNCDEDEYKKLNYGLEWLYEVIDVDDLQCEEEQ